MGNMSITKAVILETNCEIGFFVGCNGVHLNYKGMLYLHVQGGAKGYDMDDGTLGKYGEYLRDDGSNNFRLDVAGHLGLMSIYDLHYANTWNCVW